MLFSSWDLVLDQEDTPYPLEQDELADAQADGHQSKGDNDGDPGRNSVPTQRVRDCGVVDRERPDARLQCPCAKLGQCRAYAPATRFSSSSTAACAHSAMQYTRAAHNG